MPSHHALVLLLLLLLPLCVAPEPAAELSENKTPDFGDINSTWTPEALTLTFGASVLGTLPLGIGRTALTLLSEPLVLPQGARDATLFDHAELDYNPLGHPPSDNMQGGYGVPHFDVHFFVKPFDLAACENIRLAHSYAYDVAGETQHNVTALTDAAAASTAAFMAPPPPGVLPSGDQLVLDPDSIVPTQGVHWVPASDWESVYRHGTRTGLLGVWSGLSFMMGTFNGSVTFLEIMVSIDKLGELAMGRLSRTEEAPVPQPEGGASAIKQVWGDVLYPKRFFMSYDNTTDSFAVGWRFNGTADDARK